MVEVVFALLLGNENFGETIFNLLNPKFFIDLAQAPMFSPN